MQILGSPQDLLLGKETIASISLLEPHLLSSCCVYEFIFTLHYGITPPLPSEKINKGHKIIGPEGRGWVAAGAQGREEGKGHGENWGEFCF